MVVVGLVVGLAALVLGAEAVVRGASRLALGFGVPPLVVGLTIVAIGTSAPELAVSTGAALAGEAGIAAGNVVGSNVFNVLVVLGLSAVLAPLTVGLRVVRIEIPVMVAFSVGVLLLSRDGTFGRLDGGLLVVAFTVYLVIMLMVARRDGAGATANTSGPTARRPWPAAVAAILIGLVLLVVGADQLVGAAVAIARALGISELVIGLTVVAAGTSLPELATSLTAAFRGERDIAIGNVIGSNVFNLGGVLGVAGIVAPAGVAASPALMTVDLPVMVGVAALCLPIVLTGARVTRAEGAVLVALYVAYVVFLLRPV